MRRFIASVLSSSLTLTLSLAAALPARADGPSRELEYAVVASSGGVERHATVRVDFVGGSPDRVMDVDVDERDDTAAGPLAYVGIEPSGALRLDALQSLTSEEEAICTFMSLESEDLIAMGPGDHWERKGLVPGGRYLTRYTVAAVEPDGSLEFQLSRDLYRADGSVVRWTGRMRYDANGVVPTEIVLTGDAALSIRLVRDTFRPVPGA
jgi:hypothetical protein